MPTEPDTKRAVSFFDGQNLYRHAKDAVGHYHPNYDPHRLADAVCAEHGWINRGVRFYTGVPSARSAPMWHGYWTRRLTAMRRAGIAVTSRPLRYRVESIRLPDGSVHELPVQREKGIDLRLGLDVVRMARNGQMDVAVLFSQDQELAEVASGLLDAGVIVREYSKGDMTAETVAERLGQTGCTTISGIYAGAATGAVLGPVGAAVGSVAGFMLAAMVYQSCLDVFKEAQLGRDGSKRLAALGYEAVQVMERQRQALEAELAELPDELRADLDRYFTDVELALLTDQSIDAD